MSVGGSGTLSFDTNSLSLDGSSQLTVTDGVLNISSDSVVLQGQLIATGTGSIEVEAGTVTLDGSELPGSMALINTGSGHVNFTADSLSLDGAGNILINSEEGGNIEFASDSISITDSTNSGVPAISSSGNLNIETKTAGAPNPITLDTNTLALIQSGTLIVNQTTTNVAPATLTLAPVTVEENNAVGATVGTLSGTDTDLPAQTLTFGFASGSGDEDNDSFTIEGNALKAAASLDYETQASYNVRLSVSDGFGGTLEKAFVINLTDVADTPQQIWRAANFAGLISNTGNAANNADPDGDTYSNLLEYAFGTDPNNPASGPGEITFDAGAIALRAQPKLTVTNTATGVNFRANFGRRKDYVAAGLTYTVQFSADMQTWQDGTATPTVLASDAEMDAVSVKYPFFLQDGRKAQFYRVEVSVP